uniref:Uncharacterized protein n=1 Tax=Thermus caliditerrae TaxID=1330700 RepID=A0A7C5VJN4_9DEIN
MTGELERVASTLTHLAPTGGKAWASAQGSTLRAEVAWPSPHRRSAARALAFLAAHLLRGEGEVRVGREGLEVQDKEGRRFLVPKKEASSPLPGGLALAASPWKLAEFLGFGGVVVANGTRATAAEAAFYPTALSLAEVVPVEGGFRAETALGGQEGLVEVLEALAKLLPRSWEEYEAQAAVLLQGAARGAWGHAFLAPRGGYTARFYWTPGRVTAWLDPDPEQRRPPRIAVWPLSWAPRLQGREVEEALSYLEVLGVPETLLEAARGAHRLRAGVTPPGFLLCWEKAGAWEAAFGLLGEGIFRWAKGEGDGPEDPGKVLGLSREVRQALRRGISGRLSAGQAVLEGFR